MSANLKKCFRQLDSMAQTKDVGVRNALLEHFCSKDCYRKALHEVAVNLVKNKNLPLTPKQQRIVNKHKRTLIPLTKKSFSRRALIQTGKVWPLLFPLLKLAVPAISGVIGAAISKRR